MFYGCNLAGSTEGRELLNLIGTECDCDIAASDDITGHDSFGGDWELEFQAGAIESQLAFSYQTQEHWLNTLATYTVTNSKRFRCRFVSAGDPRRQR